MTAWSVPRGTAKPAPLRSSDELVEGWCEIVRLRLEASLLERGSHELVAGEAPADERRARADRLEGVLAQRIAATPEPPPLALAASRLGIADPLATVAVLVGFELDERLALLAAAASGRSGDPGGQLRIAGVAAARRDRSIARALDSIQHELAARELASIRETDEPARRWQVRGHRRWLSLAAGRLAVAEDLPLRELATADRWLSMARGRRRTVRVLGELAPATLVREATLLGAAVVFATPPATAMSSALTHAAIPAILDELDE